MLPRLAVGAVTALVGALAAAPLAAQSSRETVYFTTPNNKISRADFTNGTSTTAVTDNGTNFNGLAVRYDGNDVVTLLAANGTQRRRRARLPLRLADRGLPEARARCSASRRRRAWRSTPSATCTP